MARRKILQPDKVTGYKIVEIDHKINGPTSKIWKNLPEFFQVSELGFSVTLPPVLGAFFGLWIDKQFGTKPFITLIGVLLGAVLSFARLFSYINKFLSKQ